MIAADGHSEPASVPRTAGTYNRHPGYYQQYNGVPLISYITHKKKKKNSHNGHPRKPHYSYRCVDVVGEPLMLVPRTSQIPAHYYHHPMNYATYGHMMNYPDYSVYNKSSPSQHSYSYQSNHHHRDSFSSSSDTSSSDASSSGSASPVHFAYWDSVNNSQYTDTPQNGPKREWIHKACQEVPEVSLGITMRIMSYNILADQYASSKKLHSYCPSWALAWSYRKEKIREDIELHSPDVACLQEVPMGEFYRFFFGNLQAQGYNGIFSPKSRANTMDLINRQVVDGCAVIFRSDRFELVYQHLVEFNQLAIKNADGSNDMINRVMTKDNIALCALLRLLETDATNPNYVLVVNAHIHWDPEFSDVKLIQTMLLMCEVEKLVQNAKRELNVQDIPLIFCGDLNSLPDSGVIEFLKNGRISVDHADFKDLPYRSCLQKLSSRSHVSPEGHFCHPFTLTSVYDDEDMPYTNFTPDFKGVIDYIFTSGDRVHTNGVLGPIESTWMDEQKPIGFPCPQVPSDHLPLVAEIEIII